MEVKDHYESHLAKYYNWMFGDVETKMNDNLKFFERFGIQPLFNKACIDLGAGSGFQSIPLARLGFQVLSIDFSKQLFGELKEYGHELDIEILEADILDFEKYSFKTPELVVCMGDTLTHLPDQNSIERLFKNAFNILVDNGKLIISYRDLSFELKDEGRFIPVRSDRQRIFTCFLEYFIDYVKVHDIVYENNADSWIQKVSSYKKLRLAKQTVEEMLKNAGFRMLFSEVEKGMTVLIAEKISGRDK